MRRIFPDRALTGSEKTGRYVASHREEVAAKQRAGHRRLRLARKAAGLCVDCAEVAIQGLTTCQLHREKAAAKNRGRYQGARHIKRKYGLTPEAHADLLMSQDNRCAICRQAFDFSRPRDSVIDHDHDSGTVRGALCNRCNRGLGCFRDDPDNLREALAYLEAHRAPRLEVAQ